MKNFMRRIPLMVFIAGIASMLMAQQGQVYDNLTMTSSILKTEKRYAVYLPPGYETSQRSYPVIYLLHGGGGNQTTWIQNGNLLNIADKAIKEGSATPMIIVMPDASRPKRGWTNDAKGEWRFEDYFIQEFIPHIEQTYRIRSGRRYRAIAGLSGGGNGTFTYALHHPELFFSACPLSAGTIPLKIDLVRERLRRDDPKLPDSLIEEYFQRQSVLELIERMPEKQKNAIRWYIDCGDDDEISFEGNCLIHIAMRQKGIPHEFRVRDGGHNWLYWRSALPEVLKFVSNYHR
jgi:enterochelin esterase-like enzyme